MRAFLKKHKNSLVVKLSVLSVSLLFCLALLEIGLRTVGYWLTARQERSFIPPYEEGGYDADDVFERYKPGSQGSHLLLAFGDSLTNGGNVKSYHSFPYYLYQELNDGGIKSAVYNLGKCEESTFGVVGKLRNYLETNPPEQMPDAMVVLVGAADLFNLPLVRERKMNEGGYWRDVLPEGWLYRSRIYKVFRHIRMGLSLRRSPDAEGDVEEKFKLLKDVYQNHKRRHGAHERLSDSAVARIEPIFGDEAMRYDLDIRRVGDFMELLTDYASRVYSQEVRYDDFFSLLMDIQASYPLHFWTDFFDAANYHFVQIYQVQSKYTSQEVLLALDRSAKRHPELLENESYRTFHGFLEERGEIENYIEGRRLEAWSEIVELSRKKNVRLILQNYPVEYKSANGFLERVAKKYGIPLVDNRALFAKLIAESGRSKFLEDNDHLTPEGNRRMAENVFRTIADKNILSGTSR